MIIKIFYCSQLYTSSIQGTTNQSQKSLLKRTITAEDIKKSNLPFNTGVITHNLNFLTTFFPEQPFERDTEHASTYHNKWIMCDYVRITS